MKCLPSADFWILAFALCATLEGFACNSANRPSGSPDGDTDESPDAAVPIDSHEVVPKPEGGSMADVVGTDEGTDAVDANTLTPGTETGADGGTAMTATDPDVVAIMRKVADWQIPRAGGAKDWIHGAMWTGIMATYAATRDVKYLDAVKKWAGNWTLSGGAGARGDNQCAAQTFFDTYLQDPAGANAMMLGGAKPSFDALAANPPRGRTEWWWEDALFMVPPGFARLGTITGDKKYFEIMNNMWWDAYAFLFSSQHSLVYRDKGFLGGNTFWSRGNGWVVAGIARVLQYLPKDDPKREDFVKALNTILTALVPLQHADGLWPSNLLNGAGSPPETSGTGLITFAMAWGINDGVLDRATYLPVVRKAWKGLVAHVDATGKLGYVQNVGAAPAPARADETHEYGVGAFLLAGGQIAKLVP